MHGDIFPEHIRIADFEVGGITPIFQILSLAADGCEGEKLIATADFGMAIDHYVGVQNTVVAEFDIRADDAKWPDADIPSQRGER
jgi:hypothetical protein